MRGYRFVTGGLLITGLLCMGQAGYIHAKAQLAQLLLARAWQHTLQEGRRVKPWPWADTWPVAQLEVPRLATRLTVLAGANGASLAFAPGYVANSAAPGNPGVGIISAHRDTHFGFLRHVRRGDTLWLQDARGKRHRYRVTDTRVADSRFATITQPRSGSWLLLVTCYPFDAVRPGGPLRYVVSAEAVNVQSRSQYGSFL
jgi:sortase A